MTDVLLGSKISLNPIATFTYANGCSIIFGECFQNQDEKDVGESHILGSYYFTNQNRRSVNKSISHSTGRPLRHLNNSKGNAK